LFDPNWTATKKGQTKGHDHGGKAGVVGRMRNKLEDGWVVVGLRGHVRDGGKLGATQGLSKPRVVTPTIGKFTGLQGGVIVRNGPLQRTAGKVVSVGKNETGGDPSSPPITLQTNRRKTTMGVEVVPAWIK